MATNAPRDQIRAISRIFNNMGSWVQQIQMSRNDCQCAVADFAAKSGHCTGSAASSVRAGQTNAITAHARHFQWSLHMRR